MSPSTAQGFSQADLQDLSGRTALVTGGTAGIGFEVAKALALSKARVILTSRKDEHGEEAITKIKELDSSADIEFLPLDLGNLKATKEFGETIRKKESRLDFVVAGASIAVNKYAETFDGIERHLAITHLGHYLLINQVLPLLRRTSKLPQTPAPRIVVISSELHRTAPSATKFADFAEVNERGKDLGPNQLYSRAKLANILFVKFGLVQRVIEPSNDQIYAIAVHPGAVATGQQDQFKEAYGNLLGTMMKHVVTPFMRDAEGGSLSTLWALTTDEIPKNDWQGQYFSDPGKLGKETNQANDEEAGKNLWELSEKIVKDKVGADALLSWSSTDV